MNWEELRWYVADRDYSFSLTKALVICKNGNCAIRDQVRKGQTYIPLELLKNKLPKCSNEELYHPANRDR